MKKKKFCSKKIMRGNQPINILDKAIKEMGEPYQQANKQRTLIICLDGITFPKISQLISKGKLPQFKNLIESGVSANIKSTIPPDSIPAWPSFITGKNPAKHGLLGYFKYFKKRGESEVINSSMITHQRYWNIFNDCGLSSVIMNLPVTFPPEAIKGIMISDHLTPADVAFSHPRALSEKLKQIGYFTELVVTKFFDYDLTSPEPYIYKMNKTKDVALSILKNYDWDLFTVGFMTPDKAHHVLGLESSGINQIYEAIDSILKEILGEIDRAKCDIFILSDHGVANYEKEFSLHTWLYQKGLLKLNPLIRQFDHRRIVNAKKQGLVKKCVTEVLNIAYKIKVSLNLPSLPFFHFPRSIIELNSQALCPFDWKNTKVYSLLPPTSNFLPVFINTKGERPYGIVERGKDYQLLKEYLVDELIKLKDSDTQESVVNKIYEREDLYRGEYLSEMPDLVLELKKNYIGFTGYADRKRIIDGKVFKTFKKPVLDHSMEGVFICSGENMRRNIKLEDVSIMDIFPTVLYSRQLPIPQDIDGQVKKDIFCEEFNKGARIIPAKQDERKESVKENWLKKHSPKDIEQINQELRRLGYIK
ncbi:MAG: hypothetical protein DRP74_06445 [Candidatus Omnitrophota bacterium]|nr:MAG: hypothetical protein DRP74_06445 [Candidatus Omnitrophota bacterium]